MRKIPKFFSTSTWFLPQILTIALVFVMISKTSLINHCVLFATCLTHRHPSVEELSNIDHGDDLATVMDGIREEDYEVMAVFDSEGHKLFEQTNYNPVTVYYTEAQKQLLQLYRGADLIFLHNHPVWEEASFTIADLRSLSWYQAAYGVIVSKNQSYIITTHDQWPKPEVMEQFLLERQNLMAEIHPANVPDGMTISVVPSQVIAELAEAYNLDYYCRHKHSITSQEIAGAIYQP